MHHTGFLATAWPAVFGCDASGVVLECGSGVTKFKPGDHAFGCTFVGQNAYSTFQETFLMDEDLAFKRGGSLTTESAATIGVGLLVGWDLHPAQEWKQRKYSHRLTATLPQSRLHRWPFSGARTSRSRPRTPRSRRRMSG